MNMRDPEAQAIAEHRADRIRDELDDMEVHEIFRRLEQLEVAADAFGKPSFRRAADKLRDALDTIADIV